MDRKILGKIARERCIMIHSPSILKTGAAMSACRGSSVQHPGALLLNSELGDLRRHCVC